MSQRAGGESRLTRFANRPTQKETPRFTGRMSKSRTFFESHASIDYGKLLRQATVEIQEGLRKEEAKLNANIQERKARLPPHLHEVHQREAQRAQQESAALLPVRVRSTETRTKAL